LKGKSIEHLSDCAQASQRFPAIADHGLQKPSVPNVNSDTSDASAEGVLAYRRVPSMTSAIKTHKLIATTNQQAGIASEYNASPKSAARLGLFLKMMVMAALTMNELTPTLKSLNMVVCGNGSKLLGLTI
jgi:hypothetical protein